MYVNHCTPSMLEQLGLYAISFFSISPNSNPQLIGTYFHMPSIRIDYQIIIKDNSVRLFNLKTWTLYFILLEINFK